MKILILVVSLLGLHFCYGQTTHSVEVLLTGDCDVLSTDDLLEATKLYPNPNNGIVRIDLVEEEAMLRIMGSTGKSIFSQLLSKGTSEIELPQLASGTYLVQIQSKNKIKTSKLIIE